MRSAKRRHRLVAVGIGFSLSRGLVVHEYHYQSPWP
jgi:hypothetical protein